MKKGYRLLDKNELIELGDEIYFDDPGVNYWEPVTDLDVGGRAPDPQFISHRAYRRKIKQTK